MRKILHAYHVIAAVLHFSACVNRERCENPMTTYCDGTVLYMCGTDNLSRPPVDCAQVQSGTEGDPVRCCATRATGRYNCVNESACLSINPRSAR